jgi:soluble P-type ATPase
LIEVDIPDFGSLTLAHLVLDYNGTIAKDGEPIDGVVQRLKSLSRNIKIHVVTADTFGKARDRLAGLPIELSILDAGDQAQAKARYVESLDSEKTVAMGNGRNDRLMMEKARLGIAILEGEGCSVETLEAAEVCTRSSTEALDLILHPKRLVATLRS